MANTNIDSEIRTRIDSFLIELSALVKQAALESVQEALGGGAAPRRGPGRPRMVASRSAGRPKRLATRFARGKRTSEQVDLLAQRVFTHVKANAGHRLEEISKGLKITTKELKLPVAKLMATKKLKTQGQKRGTKYFVK